MAKSVCSTLKEFVEVFENMKKSSAVEPDWELLLRIFDVTVSTGRMYVPDSFIPKVFKWFGKVDDEDPEDAAVRVEEQTVGELYRLFCWVKIIKVTKLKFRRQGHFYQTADYLKNSL